MLDRAAHKRVNDREPIGYTYACYCSVCCAIRRGFISIDPERLAHALHDSQPCPLRKCQGADCIRLPFLTDWATRAVGLPEISEAALIAA